MAHKPSVLVRCTTCKAQMPVAEMKKHLRLCGELVRYGKPGARPGLKMD